MATFNDYLKDCDRQQYVYLKIKGVKGRKKIYAHHIYFIAYKIVNGEFDNNDFTIIEENGHIIKFDENGQLTPKPISNILNCAAKYFIKKSRIIRQKDLAVK